MQETFYSHWRFPTPVVPSFEDVVKDLRRVPAVLWGSLEGAAYKVRSYRDSECPGEQFEAGLSATIFRHHALKGLQKQGISARPDEFRWTFDRLPFLGISFYHERYHIKILKGRKGVPPGCGNSARKRQFYGQTSSLFIENGKSQRSKLNLIGLWDFDFHYGLSNLWLGCPAVGGPRPQDVRMYWVEPIPHPEVITHKKIETSSEVDSDLDSMVRLRDEGESQIRTGNEG